MRSYGFDKKAKDVGEHFIHAPIAVMFIVILL